MRGERLPYLAPLQCFLLFNLAYFAWATWAGNRMFDTPLEFSRTRSTWCFRCTRSRSCSVLRRYMGLALQRAYHFGRLRAIDTASRGCGRLAYVVGSL
jgi:hypothetical protein